MGLIPVPEPAAATAALRLYTSVGVAQILSFLLCVTGITSGLLAQKGVNAPTTQSWLVYSLLATTCGGWHLRSGNWRWRTTNCWFVYPLLAFLDVEGNFLVVKAYQYTSITSITILDCFTIPAVMVLSYLVFRSIYRPSHLLGAGLCVAGLTLLIATDQDSSTGGSHPLLGDALVIAGAAVYATCNVAQERLLSDTTQWEVLAHLGLWGTLISGVQAVVLERDAWAAVQWDGTTVAALLGFSLALYTFYMLIPTVLVMGGSTVLNISLLTSDLWAAGARALLFGGFGGMASWLYFLGAVLLEAAGMVVYTLSGSTYQRKPSPGSGGGGAAEEQRPPELDDEHDADRERQPLLQSQAEPRSHQPGPLLPVSSSKGGVKYQTGSHFHAAGPQTATTGRGHERQPLLQPLAESRPHQAGNHTGTSRPLTAVCEGNVNSEAEPQPEQQRQPGRGHFDMHTSLLASLHPGGGSGGVRSPESGVLSSASSGIALTHMSAESPARRSLE